MYERDEFWEIIKDVLRERFWKIKLVRWYRNRIWRIQHFIAGLRQLGQYRYIVESIYSPWFDISEGSDMLYMSSPENLRCKFCSCKYVPYDADAWMHATHEETQKHHKNCLWRKIDQIQRI